MPKNRKLLKKKRRRNSVRRKRLTLQEEVQANIAALFRAGLDGRPRRPRSRR
jgi:hypothetical protein